MRRIGDLVCVVWEDASFDLDEIPQLREVWTVGFVVQETATYITVGGERVYNEDGEHYTRANTTIPKSCVSEMTHLLEMHDASV